MRKKIYAMIEPSKNGEKLSSIYNIFMMLTIIISMIPLCTKSEGFWTVVIDLITVGIFIIDYFLRWITANCKYKNNGMIAYLRYPLGPLAIIDLLSILPSFGLFGQGLKVLKVFRLFRTLKVLKAFKAFKSLKVLRYSKSVSRILKAINAQKEALISVCGLALGYVLLSAIIVFNVEPDTFGSLFDAIYWACVSLTTVGYGDIYPISTAGKIVTMLSSFIGIAIVALPAGIITAGYMEALRAEKEIKENDKGVK